MINPLEAMIVLTLLIVALAIWGINAQDDEEIETSASSQEFEVRFPSYCVSSCPFRPESEVCEMGDYCASPILVDGETVISGDINTMIEYLENKTGKRNEWINYC